MKLREKACATALEFPISGVWVGGLGYKERLTDRVRILRAVSRALPAALPRFLPLCCGNPIEVLQAILLGIDVLEVPYPTQAAAEGVALTFQCKMPEEGPTDAETEEALLAVLLQAAEPAVGELPSKPPEAVLQMRLRDAAWREDFSPICEGTPVPQYSRAYICHLLEVRELLAVMILTQHNLHRYGALFEEIRAHVRRGTLRRYAAWFLATRRARRRRRATL